MHADELHKFSDGTLNDVRSALYDIVAGIRMKYLPMRKWSNSDKKRAQVMVQDIDKHLIKGGHPFIHQRVLMGLIYVDQYKRKRLMRADELHKFSDGMLNDVRSALHDIVAGIRMEYLPMRKWSNLDKKRARVMVQDIDKQLYHRRLMWNL
ncbi:hypothetical protein Tco_1502351 [Tanacetum coccineum]